ncbi:MAG: hypothetical protein PUE72_09175 [Lachnospiraceae bacterium]|nr:hypothetical protein [Lachnospiraceae bacterium]
MKNCHEYDDIIDLPHHTSKTHPRMTLYDRAAQFSPFAALSGYEAAVDETARQTEPWNPLEEDKKEELDNRLRAIMQHPEKESVTITFFRPDEKKEGGSYVTVRGTVKKIDLYTRTLRLMDGTQIDIDRIVEIAE